METRQEKIARLQSILANPTAIAPLTADQKRGFDAARLTRLDATKELDQSLSSQQQENTPSTLSTAIQATNDILSSTSDVVSHVPTPGTIATPLIILLVFFLALIPIAGNTRLKWLWLVVSGNADMVAGVASGDFKSTSNASAAQSTPSYSIGIIPYMSLEV